MFALLIYYSLHFLANQSSAVFMFGVCIVYNLLGCCNCHLSSFCVLIFLFIDSLILCLSLSLSLSLCMYVSGSLLRIFRFLNRCRVTALEEGQWFGPLSHAHVLYPPVLHIPLLFFLSSFSHWSVHQKGCKLSQSNGMPPVQVFVCKSGRSLFFRTRPLLKSDTATTCCLLLLPYTI